MGFTRDKRLESRNKEIIDLYDAGGITHAEIANRYGLSIGRIQKIISGTLLKSPFPSRFKIMYNGQLKTLRGRY